MFFPPINKGNDVLPLINEGEDVLPHFHARGQDHSAENAFPTGGKSRGVRPQPAHGPSAPSSGPSPSMARKMQSTKMGTNHAFIRLQVAVP